MNEQERCELDRLQQRQTNLQEQLSLLAGQIKALEARWNSARPVAAPPVMEIQPLEIEPAEIPPLMISLPESQLEISPAIPNANQRQALPKPPPLPPLIPHPPAAVRTETRMDRAPVSAVPAPGVTPNLIHTPPVFETPPVAEPTTSKSGESSFEMRLGTYWLVRVGVVMLLTALAFFGYYAYERYIPRLGAAGKVTLLYLASGALLGIGAWFQRSKARESLKNYGQVVFAGGLAAVYFTTYAAYHIENLRVIPSALVDGALLLGWAAFMVWIADRRKSEVLALFAVGLAYYSSVITNMGLFTLYSNLVLTLAAVFFLVRNRWAHLSLACLAATYASYVFWRFIHGGQVVWREEQLANDFWTGNLFLLGYWILFTAAVFLAKQETFARVHRAAFLSLNNGAFFALVTLSLLLVHRDWFWAFAGGYGVALLGLAVLAGRVWTEETLPRNSYLTQGLVLFTVGLIARFSGLQLALLLGGQSVVLIVLGELQKNRILRGGSYMAAALALVWAIGGLKRFDSQGLLLGAAVGVAMTFNAWWVHRHDPEADKSLLRLRTAWFTGLALVIWLMATLQNTAASAVPAVLAAEAMLLTVAFYLLRLRELAIPGQSYLVLAQALLLLQLLSLKPSMPWWNSAAVIAITLGLSHWWQRQQQLKCEAPLRQFVQGFYALAIVGMTYAWLRPHFTLPVWLALTSLLAVGFTAYGVWTRAWLLAVSGQLFLVASIQQFVVQLLAEKPVWHFPLAPIAAAALFSFAVARWFARHPAASHSVSEPLLQFARVYRWLALAMSLGWIYAYIPARDQFWVLALLGFLAFLWAGWRRNAEALLFGAAFTITGLGLFWFPTHATSTIHWTNLLAILTLLGQQQLARRAPEKFQLDPPIHAGVIMTGGLSLWLLLSRWVLLESGGFYLTMAWSVLALSLFVLGLTLRERMYRWLGLAVLGCALGRVIFFDVWELQTIYRIISFMALGIVLLVLGFIYNKYLEKIRQWL